MYINSSPSSSSSESDDEGQQLIAQYDAYKIKHGQGKVLNTV